MGQSHSWTLPDECDPVAFDRAVTDMDAVVRRLAPGAFSTGGTGCRPYAECDGVRMLYLRADGVALVDQAAGGEVFRIDRDIGVEELLLRERRERLGGTAERRGYFKPLGSPANLVACCFLIVLQRHLGGELAVVSDVEGDGWRRAAALCQEVLGYGGDAAIGADGALRMAGGGVPWASSS